MPIRPSENVQSFPNVPDWTPAADPGFDAPEWEWPDGLEPETAEGGIEFSRKIRSRGESEFFTDCHADGRGDLNGAVFLPFVKSLPDDGGLVLFDDGAGRAMGGTLSAPDAR